MAVLRYFHQDPRQTSVQESSVIDKQGTVLTQKLTTINQSITNNTQVLEDKLNSVPGKSLSTNDFTDEYKNKLRGIEEGAEVNVQSDWGEDDNTADSYIKNKPVIDDIVTQNSENLITSGAVFTAIDELPEPMIFKGSLGTGGTIQTLPAPSADNVGFVYKVITAGAYYGITAKPGDSFISDGSDWILIPSGDEPEGTVMSVGLSVPTGLLVSGSPITTSGTLAITYALGYAIPTTAKLDEWDAKQNAISDLSTIRTNASNGNTAYGWGNHANAGYVKSSGVTSVAMTVPTGLSISGSPITSTGTLALSFANGYSIPTTAKLSNWDTAYGWGNHANAGYLTGITKAMVTNALGYTPPQQDTNTTYSAGSGLSLSGTTFSLALTKALVTTALGYTPPTQDTNTWRGILNNLTSDSTTDSLSAAQGKALANGSARDSTKLPLAGGTMSGDITMPTTKAFYGTLGDFSTTALSDVGGLSWKNLSGKQSSSVNVYDTPSTADTWWYILRNRHTNTYNNYYTDVAIPFNANGIYYKRINNGSIVNNTIKNGWIAVLDELNSSVSLSGSTLTVKINGVEKSLTNTNTTYNFSGVSFTSGLSDTGSHDANAITTNGHWYYNANGPVTSIGASTGDGALYSLAYNTSWVGLIALDYRNGGLYVRGKNNGTWQSWYRVWDSRSLTNLNLLTNGPGYITSSGSCSYASSIPSRTIWGQSFNGTANVNGTFYFTNGDATMKIYGAPSTVASYGNERVAIQTSFDNQDPETSSYPTSYPDRAALLLLPRGGRVGVGTTSPSTRMHVVGRVTCEYSSAYSGSFSAIRDVYEGRFGINSSGYTILTTNKVGDSSARVRISLSPHTDADRRILLLDNVELSNGSGIYLASSYSSSSDPFYIQKHDLYDNDVSIGRPGDSGRPWVGIGIRKPSYKLHVNGACGATSFPNTSDIRLKDILSEWLPKLEDIANAPSFLFKWNNIKDDTVHLGSSAQYWEEKAPNVVTEANDEIKTKSLQYDVLGTVNSIAIAKEVVSLKEEIKLLQALIAELKLLLNN